MLRWLRRLRPAVLLSFVALSAPAAIAGCASDDVPSDGVGIHDLGVIGDSATDGAVKERVVAIDLAAGKTKWFRIKAVRFSAELDQSAGSSDVPARLSAKHYEVEIEGTSDVTPSIEAVAEEELLRNWTLRVHNEGNAPLVGTLTVAYIEELSGDPPDGEQNSSGATVLGERDVTVQAGDTKRYRRSHKTAPSLRSSPPSTTRSTWLAASPSNQRSTHRVRAKQSAIGPSECTTSAPAPSMAS